MAADAWERLPPEFREKCDGVLIRVEDFATDEVLQSLGIESPFDLLGLYHGVSLEQKSVMDLPRQPDMVFLYRRPILEEWAEGGEPLGDARHPRPGPRDRPSFRVFRRRHGADRGGSGGLSCGSLWSR